MGYHLMTDEIWKTVPRMEIVEVSNLGNVRFQGKQIKPYYDKSTGYQKVNLVIPLHRLICMAFHGPPPFPEAQALHKNHIRKDVDPDNIHWVSRQENMEDMKKAGRSLTGERNNQAKLTWEKVAEMRRLFLSGSTQSSIALTFNVCEATASYILRNKYWKDPNYDPSTRQS